MKYFHVGKPGVCETNRAPVSVVLPRGASKTLEVARVLPSGTDKSAAKTVVLSSSACTDRFSYWWSVHSERQAFATERTVPDPHLHSRRTSDARTDKKKR